MGTKYYLCLFAMFISMALSAEPVEVNGIYYNLDVSKKSAQVTRNPNSYSGNVVIPDIISYQGDNYSVNSIDGKVHGDYGLLDIVKYGAFENCTAMTSISIPQSIKSIGFDAFDGCTGLNAVYITSLDAWCNIWFAPYCGAVEGTSSNPLKYAHHLYLNNELVDSLVIPESITELNTIVFYGGYFSSITFHKNLKSIYDDSFWYCKGITDIYSYSPEINVKFGVFSLLSIFGNIKEQITLHVRERYKKNYESNYLWNQFKETVYIPGVDYLLKYYVDGALYKDVIMEVGEAIIPEQTPSKVGYTFDGWSDIPETMPDHDVNVIGTFSPNTYKLTYYVDGKLYKVVTVKCDETITAELEPTKKGMTFSGWSNIPEKMPAKDVTVTGTFSWSKITNNKIIYQITDTITNYAAVIGNNEASDNVTIASGIEFDYNYKVTYVADGAFNGCKDITSIEIPATITNIGERAFAKIDKLTDVTVSAVEVPTTDRTAFENSYIDYVTLHVPAGSVDKYKAVGPWKNFKEVVPIDESTTIAPILSVERQKASYNLNGINISKTHKPVKGIIIREGKKYNIK